MTTNTTAQPRTIARASITDFRGNRYLEIDTLEGRLIARIRLTGGSRGKGTWAEIDSRLAARGYKVRTGFKWLDGAGLLRATLARA